MPWSGQCRCPCSSASLTWSSAPRGRQPDSAEHPDLRAQLLSAPRPQAAPNGLGICAIITSPSDGWPHGDPGCPACGAPGVRQCCVAAYAALAVQARGDHDDLVGLGELLHLKQPLSDGFRLASYHPAVVVTA